MPVEPLVTIALPVYNGEASIERVTTSVLAQTYSNLEFLISDNASTDGTQDFCRELARTDDRVVYRRHGLNIGLVPNFTSTLQAANGTYFRWVGNGDWLAPEYVSRGVQAFAAERRRLLVSTELEYELPDGTTTSASYQGDQLGSPDPAERFGEMLRLLTTGYAVLDPLYSLLHREPVTRISWHRILRGDEVFAAQLALAGPWGHVPEVLGGRGWSYETLPTLAGRLGIPRWHVPIATVIQCRALLAEITAAGLTPGQDRRARAEVGRFYQTRVVEAARRARRKVARTMTYMRERAACSVQ